MNKLENITPKKDEDEDEVEEPVIEELEKCSCGCKLDYSGLCLKCDYR